MVNRWVQFVKDFASRNNLTYACAISTPACKEEYRAKYGNRKKLPQKKEREMMEMEDVRSKAVRSAEPEKKKRELMKKLAIEAKEKKEKMAMKELMKKLAIEAKEKKEEMWIGAEGKRRLVELSRMMGEDIKPKTPADKMVEAIREAGKDPSSYLASLSKRTTQPKMTPKAKPKPKPLIIEEEEEEPKENITIEMTEVEPVKKKRGRPKKYATAEEAKQAKYAQTTASKKRTAEMRKKLLEEAKKKKKPLIIEEDDEVITSAPKKKKKPLIIEEDDEVITSAPKKQNVAEKVLSIKELKDTIQSYIPKTFTEKGVEDVLDDYVNWFDYYYEIILALVDTDFPKWSNKNQRKRIEESARDNISVFGVLKSLIKDRLDFLIKQNNLQEVDWDKQYYEDTDYSDFRKIGVDSDGRVSKTTENDLAEIWNEGLNKYRKLMAKMGVSENEAIEVLNKRLMNRDIPFRFSPKNKKGGF